MSAMRWLATAGIVALCVGAGCGKTPRGEAAGDLRRLAAALDMYCLEFSEYPPTLDDTNVQAKLRAYDAQASWTDRWERALAYRRASPAEYNLCRRVRTGSRARPMTSRFAGAAAGGREWARRSFGCRTRRSFVARAS